ncbi:MAG: hypothetical protein LBR94_03495 [Desulfovibrio sp.]|jgi:hypothetical protein|nr:hypothetical protein [Desulfovibrio sp.]
MKKRLSMYLLLAYTFLISPIPLANAAESLCTSGEIVVFTCQTPKKIASVCASPKFGPDTGYLQYRFGELGKIELTLPGTETPPAKSAQKGIWSFAGGGGAYMRFAGENNTDYFVYSAIGKWGMGGEITDVAGIYVQKDAKAIINIKCRRPFGDGEMGPDFFDKAGIPEFDKDFELPE